MRPKWIEDTLNEPLESITNDNHDADHVSSIGSKVLGC